MEKIATNLAVKIMGCRSILELEAVSNEIKALMIADPKFKTEWRDWLLDMWWSKNKELTTPSKPFEDTLNARGKKKFLKGESLEC